MPVLSNFGKEKATNKS